MSRNLASIRRAFGLLFVTIAIAVAVAAMLSELALFYHGPLFSYAIIWISCIAMAMGSLFSRSPSTVPNLRERFKESRGWPSSMKGINGISWAAPFALIPFFPAQYPYLVLLGIGLGNVSTYLVFRHMGASAFREQLIVGAISLASLPFLLAMKSLNVVPDDALYLILRLCIALAYGVGGIYALVLAKELVK